LLSDDPERAVASGISSGGKVGTSTIDGTRCNHFFFVQASDDLELELWLEDNERALPCRFVVTYRARCPADQFSSLNFPTGISQSKHPIATSSSSRPPE
jgi:hypothetical protein